MDAIQFPVMFQANCNFKVGITSENENIFKKNDKNNKNLLKQQDFAKHFYVGG